MVPVPPDSDPVPSTIGARKESCWYGIGLLLLKFLIWNVQLFLRQLLLERARLQVCIRTGQRRRLRFRAEAAHAETSLRVKPRIRFLSRHLGLLLRIVFSLRAREPLLLHLREGRSLRQLFLLCGQRLGDSLPISAVGSGLDRTACDLRLLCVAFCWIVGKVGQASS